MTRIGSCQIPMLTGMTSIINILTRVTIWHAGDLGTDEIADKFEVFKTFRAVAGNIDGLPSASAIPAQPFYV